MRRFLVASLATSLGLAVGAAGAPVAADAAGGTPAAGYTPPPIVWAACADPALVQRSAQCAMITVPLDYAKPGGTKIQLAVSRIRHTSPAADYQGAMLTNPGGPGGSGLTMPTIGQAVPDGAGADYDWIGFDPRGVGSSVPALSCDPDYTPENRPDYRPLTIADERAWEVKTREYAADCARAGGALLDHVKSVDTVNDMESIRKALGTEQISFYGESYGTYLGQVYATLYPSRVHRMVLDSNVDPRTVWYQDHLNQSVAFDAVANVFFGWVARNDAVYHLGTRTDQVAKKWYQTVDRLAKAPVDGIGPDEWNDVFLNLGYADSGWASYAAAFSAFVNDGDISTVKASFERHFPSGPGSDRLYAMYLAVQCTDAPWPANQAKEIGRASCRERV